MPDASPLGRTAVRPYYSLLAIRYSLPSRQKHISKVNVPQTVGVILLVKRCKALEGDEKSPKSGIIRVRVDETNCWHQVWRQDQSILLRCWVWLKGNWQTTLLLVRPTSQSPQPKWNLSVWREIKPSQKDVRDALIELEARGIGIAINNQIAANQTQVN